MKGGVQMKTLTINKVSMTGFKNQKERIEFLLRLYSIISGDNGKGKTTLGEAIVWALLGTNLSGNEKSDSKLINEECKITEVEIQFTADDGEHTVIRRRRAKTCDIFLDDQMITNAGLMQRLNLDKRTFLTIFNPNYFSTLEPKEAKEFLLKELGEVSKDEVLGAMDECYRELLINNGFRNADIFLEDKRAELKGVDEDVIYLQGIMDGNKSIQEIPQELKFNEVELRELQKQLEETQQLKLTPVHDISDLKAKKSELQSKIVVLQSSHDDVNLQETVSLEKEIYQLEMRAATVPVNNPVPIDIQSLEKRRVELVKEYNDLKAEYTNLGNATVECPQCGTQVDINERERARVKARLEEVRHKGCEINTEIQTTKVKNQQALDEYNQIVADHIVETQKAIEETRNKLNKVKMQNEIALGQHSEKVNKEIAAINSEIVSLNIASFEEDNKIAEHKFNAEKQSKIEVIKRQISIYETEKIRVIQHNTNRDSLLKQLEESKEKIEKAKEDIKKTEPKKAAIKSQIEAAKKFNATKLELQTKMIDQYLDKVSIRLQKLVESTGELKDDFKIMYEGKEFNVLSASERIKAGLELSNLIMNVTDIKYPIFIDNKESITSYNKPDTQIIEAMVVEGQELKIA
jgi:chromosome segregation ATPase